MFPLSYNTNGLRSLSLPDAVAAVGAAGYPGVEISAHPAHLDPLTAGADELGALRRALGAARVQPACLATGAAELLGGEPFEPSLVSRDAAGRARRVALIRRAVEVARALGCPVVNFASGKRRDDVDPRQARRFLVEGLRQCLEGIGGVTLALEPEPGFFVQYVDEAISVVREVGSPRLRLNLDIGHMRVCEEHFLESIERSARFAVHVHIEDIRDRVHKHLVPGEGDIDFPAVFGALSAGGYSGFLSVELYDHGERWHWALRQARAQLLLAFDAARQRRREMVEAGR
jgi:sugar phosphate isomerase/epimerase